MVEFLMPRSATESGEIPAENTLWNEVQNALGDEYLAKASPAKLQAFTELIGQASHTGHDPAGPVREVQALVGDRWCGLLLPLLHFGPLRFSTLQKIVDLADQESISRRMLSYKLRALERDGLVQRIVRPGMAQRVEYSLTALGEQFFPVFMQLIRWLDAHNEVINAARRDFEQQDSDADAALSD
jgi:DNA-binding HxlR family transcriptional regulator